MSISDLNLTVYGPLGIMALVAIIAATKLYFDRERDRAAFAAQLKTEREACEKERREAAEEYRTLEERYIAKAETWMGKYEEFAKAATAVVDAAMRRYRGDSGGSHGGQGQG